MTSNNERFDAQIDSVATQLGRWAPLGDPQIARRRHIVRRRRRQSMSMVAAAAIIVSGLVITRNLNDPLPAQQVQVGTTCDNQRLFVLPLADDVEAIEAQLREDPRLKVGNIHRGPDAAAWIDLYEESRWWTATTHGMVVPRMRVAHNVADSGELIEAALVCGSDSAEVVASVRLMAGVTMAWSSAEAATSCGTPGVSEAVVTLHVPVNEVDVAKAIQPFTNTPSISVYRSSSEENQELLNGLIGADFIVSPVHPTIRLVGQKDALIRLLPGGLGTIGTVTPQNNNYCFPDSGSPGPEPIQFIGFLATKCADFDRSQGTPFESCPASVAQVPVSLETFDGAPFPINEFGDNILKAGHYSARLMHEVTDWGCSAQATMEFTVNSDNAVLITRLGESETSLLFEPVNGHTLVPVGIKGERAVCTGGSGSATSQPAAAPMVTIEFRAGLTSICADTGECAPENRRQAVSVSTEVIDSSGGVARQVASIDDELGITSFSVPPGTYGLMLQSTDAESSCSSASGDVRSPLSAGASLTVNADGTVRLEAVDASNRAVDQSFGPYYHGIGGYMTAVSMPTIGGHCG